MKKTLSVLLAVCLVFAMCIPAFAKSVDAGKKSAVSARAREVIAELNAEPTTDEEGNEVEKISTTQEAAKAIFDAIKKAGASNAAEANDAADQLYNNGDIENEVYKAIKAEAAKDGAFDDAEPSDSDIIAKITAIFNDDSLSITDKIFHADRLEMLYADETKLLVPAEGPELCNLSVSEAVIILNQLFCERFRCPVNRQRRCNKSTAFCHFCFCRSVVVKYRGIEPFAWKIAEKRLQYFNIMNKSELQIFSESTVGFLDGFRSDIFIVHQAEKNI